MRDFFRKNGCVRNMLLLAGLLGLASGCGKRGTVSGTVYYRGQPLKVGMVQFFPESQGGDFSSPIKEDGSYRIAKLPVGPVKIAVISNTVNPLANMPPMARGKFAEKGMKGADEQMKKSKAGGEGNGASPFDVSAGRTTPKKYADPDTSELRLDVTGGMQQFDIKLE